MNSSRKSMMSWEQATANYEDPDENEWVLPPLPDLDSVPDNTSCFGPFYFWRGMSNPAQKWISIAITREITPPWRRGLGLTVRQGRLSSDAKAIGIWKKGNPPRILSNSPVEKNWRKVVKRSRVLSER
jgi:hypothetical protein